jgi:hypothetical protein
LKNWCGVPGGTSIALPGATTTLAPVDLERRLAGEDVEELPRAGVPVTPLLRHPAARAPE